MTVKIYLVDIFGRCINRHLSNVYDLPFFDSAKLLQPGSSTLIPLPNVNSFSIGDIIISTGVRSNEIKMVKQANNDSNEELYIAIVCYYDIATSRPCGLDCSNIIRNLLDLYAYLGERICIYISNDFNIINQYLPTSNRYENVHNILEKIPPKYLIQVY